MSGRGRGKGWEESVQQEVFKKYLESLGLHKDSTFFKEVSMSTTEFKNTATESRADFIIVHDKYLELVECKSNNHPYQIGSAIGQLLVYRYLLLESKKWPDNIPKIVDIHISICMVDGYKDGKSEYIWTDKHTELIRKLEKTLQEQITIYLVQPKEGKATKEYWEEKESQEVKIQNI